MFYRFSKCERFISFDIIHNRAPSFIARKNIAVSSTPPHIATTSLTSTLLMFSFASSLSFSPAFSQRRFALQWSSLLLLTSGEMPRDNIHFRTNSCGLTSPAAAASAIVPHVLSPIAAAISITGRKAVGRYAIGTMPPCNISLTRSSS